MISLLQEYDKKIINDTAIFNIIDSNEEVVDLSISSILEDKIIINISDDVKIKLLNLVKHVNKQITINIGKNAIVNFNIASFEKEDGNSIIVNMEQSSEMVASYADFSIDNNHFVFLCNLNGEESHINWHLSSLLKNKDKKSFEISFNHYEKNTYAKMENYGVCEEQSNLSFLGTSKIYKGAKRSETHQNAKIMVFDKECVAKASPSLCIDENDVQASHAAIVGQINEEHIFYLTSRGINEKDAKKLITLGYLNPILNYFPDGEIKDTIKNLIEKRV